MNIVERLNEAIERLEPVEKRASAGPWQRKFSFNVECADGSGPLSAGGNIQDFDTRNGNNAAFIAAMRPTSEPEYYTKLLQDARAEIFRLQDELLRVQLENQRLKRERTDG